MERRRHDSEGRRGKGTTESRQGARKIRSILEEERKSLRSRVKRRE